MQISSSCSTAGTPSQPSLVRRPIGRPRVNLDGAQVVAIRDGNHLSWRAMAKQLSVGATTIRRAYEAAKRSTDATGLDLEPGGGAAKGSIKQESI